MNRKQKRKKGTKIKGDKQNKMVELNLNIPIITVKVSSLNTPTKRQTVGIYIFLKRPNYMLSSRNPGLPWWHCG